MIEMDEFTIKAMNNALGGQAKIISKLIRKNSQIESYDSIIEVKYKESLIYINSIYTNETQCQVTSILNDIKKNIKQFEKLSKTQCKQNHKNYIRVSANLKLQKELNEMLPIMYVKKVNEIMEEEYKAMVKEEKYKKGFTKMYNYLMNDYIGYCVKEKEALLWE